MYTKDRIQVNNLISCWFTLELLSLSLEVELLGVLRKFLHLESDFQIFGTFTADQRVVFGLVA